MKFLFAFTVISICISAHARSDISPFSSHGVPLSLESQLANVLFTSQDPAVVVSLPVNLSRSSYNPFGDGQTDAKMDLGSEWKNTDFPVIGFQRTMGGIKTRTYQFHPSLGSGEKIETEMGQGWFRVQLKGRSDYFYFNFNSPAMAISEFLEGIPLANRSFSGSRVAPDPAKIGSTDAFKILMKRTPGVDYNSTPFYNDNVHAHFPDPMGPVNALGGVSTWGINLNTNDKGSFKQLYTCFDARNISAENKLGVPSGAGWHRIGDPVESILNDLEQNAIPSAIGRTHGLPNSAFGMTETVTAFWLGPQQVFVTTQGQFHWYVNPYATEVCTEVWVHNCVPNLGNNWGMNCPRGQ